MNTSIILVEPQMGENIGAAARAMKNFAATDLRIVNPRDSWPNAKAIAMAAGGKDIISNATIYTSLSDACADLHYLYATTAARRDLNKNNILLPDIHQTMPLQQKYGIIFGREKSGLTNDEISIANAIITIPTSNQFGSLNLGQAVLAVCYELFVRNSNNIPKPNTDEHATHGEISAMIQHLFDELDNKNYFANTQHTHHSKSNLTNLLMRIEHPSRSEINQLRGIIRALSKKCD